jgi:septal ring factor EnvC (AmiA/AmiB activator)
VSNPSIYERLAGCLQRQIESFGQARRDLLVIERGGEAAVTDEVLASQARNLQATIQLDEELQLLLPEWNTATPRPTRAEREHIARLAAEAEELADDLQRLYGIAQDMALAHAARIKDERDALRAQRAPLRYRPSEGVDPRHMDEKA